MTERAKDGEGYAALLHVFALLGNFVLVMMIPFLNLIIPLVMWLCKKNENEFIDFHGREAIRFQLFMMLYGFVFVVALLMLFGTSYFGAALNDPSVFLVASSGFAILLIFGVLALLLIPIIFPIVAAVKASNGERYCYPFVFSPRKKQLVAQKT